MKPSQRKKPYFVEPFEGKWQVRENHELMFGIAGGSGFVADGFDTRREALRYARQRTKQLARLESAAAEDLERFESIA